MIIEGDDTAYGQALFPVPAEDPNDPLQARTASVGFLARLIGASSSGQTSKKP